MASPHAPSPPPNTDEASLPNEADERRLLRWGMIGSGCVMVLAAAVFMVPHSFHRAPATSVLNGPVMLSMAQVPTALPLMPTSEVDVETVGERAARAGLSVQPSSPLPVFNKIQALGGRDLVNAWAARTNVPIGDVNIRLWHKGNRCSTTIVHGKEHSRTMMGEGPNPIAACRALITTMEKAYPDLGEVSSKTSSGAAHVPSKALLPTQK